MSSEHDSLVVEIRDLFKQLDRVASRADRFGWDHPATVTVLAAAEAAFIEALERSPRTLRVDVHEDGFVVDDVHVWVPPSPLEGATASLYAAGIRAVTIMPGVRRYELRGFIAAMLDDCNDESSPDDDVRTALWDAALVHIRFEIGSDDTGAKRNSARIVLAQGPIDRVLRAETLQALLREFAQPTAAKLIDALTSDFATETPEAYITLHGRVRTAAAALIARGDLRRLLEIYDAAHERSIDVDDPRALAAKSIEAAIFEGDLLAAVFEFLRAAPRYVKRFGKILETLPGSRVGDALVALRLGAEGELRDVLEAFVERAARGHEAEVARAIVDSPRSVAVRLLAALARVQTSAAAAEISRLSKHEDEDVRLDAKLLGASDPVRAAEDVVQMVDSPDAATRTAALRAIGRHHLQGATFTLLRRLRVPTFVDLQISEQAELLRALLRLAPEQGESIALEMLRSGGMFQSDAREATRLVAVELLGEHAVSNNALEALREAAKTHWGASRTMRDAAENAARALDDRLSQSAPASQAAPSGLVETPIDAAPPDGARFDFSEPDRRSHHAAIALELAARADADPKLSILKRASQELADLRDVDIASVAHLAISERAQRDDAKLGALVTTLVAGMLRQLGAPPSLIAQGGFAALECENARFRAKSSSADAVVSSRSFGRLDEIASRRVIVAVESLTDFVEGDAPPSLLAQILGTARRFVRALAGRSSVTPGDLGSVLASMLERAENPRERLVVQLVGRVLDPPLTATARGSLAVTPFVHLLAYMLDHRASGSIEMAPPQAERIIVIFRDGVPVLVHPRLESSSVEVALTALGRLPDDTKYVFYKDVDLIEVNGETPSFYGDLCIALSAARVWSDRSRIERMLARIAHRRLVLHPHARVEGIDSTPIDRDIIAALRRGARLPELRVAYPDALADVDTLIYVLAVMRQLSIPGQHGEPIGSRAKP
ncbi:MAG: hypothetical protein ABI461_00865 [Polyangiaceae bacterium]